MPSPSEKAKELVDKFREYCNGVKFNAKSCAVICVDEVLLTSGSSNFWMEVKREIEKL